MIGKHFPDVDDKLLNLLDLKNDTNQTELLLASIEQRSEHLNPIPFAKAVSYKDNIRYLKYLAIPFVVCALIGLSGSWKSFFGSYKRVVNYDLAYEEPAPFSFELLTNNLSVLDSKPHKVQVVTKGEVRPEAIFLNVDGNKLLLQESNGVYEYTFTPPLRTVNFSFEADEVNSRTYTLNALKTPIIDNFELLLAYPAHTEMPEKTLKSTGSAIFPEGTKVTWVIGGSNINVISLITKDAVVSLANIGEQFSTSKRVFNKLKYQLSTSNDNVRDFEKLAYEFDVIKDEYPSIKVKQVLDSLNPNTSYYIGNASDDYKLNSLELVCYATEDKNKKQRVKLATLNRNSHQFYYTFPSGLVLEPSVAYSYYFEVTDNDAIHSGKTSKSQVFNTMLLNEDQLANRDLEAQKTIVDSLDKSLDKVKEQKEALDKISTEHNQKKALNFNDKNQVKNFLQKQQQQENMMQKFSKQLKANLEKQSKDVLQSKLLKERLERQELEAKRNQKLLEELNKVADKINKEDLEKKLEEIGKKQKNSERNLEQLLELTKRYYVTEKAAQLGKDLELLAKKQELLSDLKLGEDFSNKEQEKLNQDFENIAKDMEELKLDNQDLNTPIELNIDDSKTEGVKEDQKDALDEINKHNGDEQSSNGASQKESASKVAKKQKSAAQKMKDMSEQLQKSSSAGGGGGESITEDAVMLRQILDNLITFSFKQEGLFEKLEQSDIDALQFASTIREQKELKGMFEHVDDSLFSLSLRRAELAEFVNEQITEVYYNVDKSLETIAENQIYQAMSYQKYVLNASNSLADFLVKLLDNMESSMQSGEGEGEGEGFQLPDIIKSQGQLQQKMKGQGESKGEGEKGKGGESDKGKKGQGQEGQGEGKKPGGKTGEGKSGSKEQSGNSTGEGQGGEDAKKGQGQANGVKGEEGNLGKGNAGSASEKGAGGNNGEGNGPSEEELREIYEIYKEQQEIRQLLEDQLQNMINSSDRKLGEKLVQQMEDFEDDLLENGFTPQTMSKMNIIQYKLLKLENAAMKQGKKEERKSNTNTGKYVNPITTKPSLLDNYTNDVEILNRQALPLRQNYQSKVKSYFKKDD